MIIGSIRWGSADRSPRAGRRAPFVVAGALLIASCSSSDQAGPTSSSDPGVTNTSAPAEEADVDDTVAPGAPGSDVGGDDETEGVSGRPPVDLRPMATPEQEYALSLPVLEHFLQHNFAHAWIATANTIEAAAKTLDHAALSNDDYSTWVATFAQVVEVAAAVADGDQDAALAAFQPLIADHPGPYVDAVVDTSLSPTPYPDAETRLDALDAAILAADRDATRAAAGDVAEALAEVAVSAQLKIADDPGAVFRAMLPALRAIGQIQQDVLTGTASDGATHAAVLRTAFEEFVAAFPAPN